MYESLWFAAPQAASAPVNDLLMLQLIEYFVEVYMKFAGVAEKKMWYQSEKIAALSLFSDDVSVDDKEAIVNALLRDPFPEHLRRLASNQITRFQGPLCGTFSSAAEISCICNRHMGCKC